MTRRRKPGCPRPALVAILHATLVAFAPAAARAEPDSLLATPSSMPEAPVDAGDDDDVTFERADADTGSGVEVALGLRGLGGGAPRRARTLRFLGDGLDGVVRDGADDPLSGAEIGGQTSLSAWRVGRVAPQWGCGWLVGAPVAPWGDAGAAPGLGLRAGPRGDVASFSFGEVHRFDAMVGRFAKREVAAVRGEVRGFGLMVAGTRRGLSGAGLATGHEAASTELAFDRRGRWRGEIAVARDAARGRLALRARGGSPGFRPLLAPTRGGPAGALAADWTLGHPSIRPRAGIALWRFGNGATGTRGRLEVDLRLAHHATASLGLEEQRGTRKETTSSRGMRQGWFGEWRGGRGPVSLTLGLENWGRRSRGRSPVRTATLAAAQLATPMGGWLRIEQRAYRAGSGEGYRAPEFEADRVVLRALSGAGERTRIEMMVPGPAGKLRAGLTFNATASKSPRMQWTLDWTRRAKLKGGPP